MKRIIAALLAAVGIHTGTRAASDAKTVDTNSILYSMATVAADSLEFVEPTPDSFQDAPQFHEDEWAQLEFFPKSRLPDVQAKLQEFKAFEKANRTQQGWKQIYARNIARTPLLAAQTTAADLGERLPAPVLVTSSQLLGQVKDGFSIQLGENAYLYGLAGSQGITLLAADLAGADDRLLTQAFIRLSTQHSLILVDWRQQMVLVSVTPNGQIEVWQP